MPKLTDPPDGGKAVIRSPLRLVHPAPPRSPRRKYQRAGSPFTGEEQARLRAAMRHARVLFGTWNCAADAMRIGSQALKDAAGGRHAFTGDLAVRLARALGVSVESLYRAPTDASTCPTCGARRGP